MKKLIYLLLLFFTITVSAQQADKFTDNNNDRPRDPRADQMNFVPNEVLVKFKDEVILKAGTNLKSAGIGSVDQILTANGAAGLEKLFPTAKRLKSARIVKDPQGREMIIPNLDNIYKITILQQKSTGSAPANIFKLIEELKALPEVDYAEPNFVYSIGDFKAAGPEMTMLEAINQPSNSNLPAGATGLIPNDPLYYSQWGIPATKIDVVWNTTTGDSTAIIAILDTGVDWQHPDLAANIWQNKQEIPGNGIDDDGNGLIDDIRGWDYINNDNNPTDDNSHGTHVAGIAAAVGNNGIGIAGVNWKARIMPIKVFQSSGRGDAATIAMGITYAATKGATVINMSFGSYTESLTMKNALANAYATAVLVAAAGNDGRCIGPGLCPDNTLGVPMFPGAYSFVLGVEAPPSPPVGFTNYDQDGPVFSRYKDQLNYELMAPGTDIFSCVPGGNYRKYNGTSMASPLVAGAVSLYRKLKPEESQELLFGNFINSLGQYIDLDKALNVTPVPNLQIVSYELKDTIDGDRDGRPDAGETIELNVKVRNTWGQSDSIFVGIKFKEFEDTTTAIIQKSSAPIGLIGPYSTLTNSKNLLRVKIQPNVAHKRDINFILQTWNGYKREFIAEQKITIQVEHGTELKGLLEDTLRLTPDKYWLVINSFKISPTGVLIIEPGTTLKIEKQISNFGKILSVGTKDSIINIIGPMAVTSYTGDLMGGGTFKYVNFNSLDISDWKYYSNYYYGAFDFTNCTFENFSCSFQAIITTGIIRDCVFSNFTSFVFQPIDAKYIYSSNFINFPTLFTDYKSGEQGYHLFKGIEALSNCNFANITSSAPIVYRALNTSVSNNNVLSNCYFFESEFGIKTTLAKNYWGSIDSLIIQNKIVDFWDNSNLAIVKYQPILFKPDSVAHACVWKVVVNGKDAQDEFKSLDPLGVATHKFEVYFNRPMDKKYPPTVSMGVREPFTQVMINENGSWSNDSLIYTVYKNIGLTANNGLNRIRVINGKDTEGFDLVPESERFNVNIQTTASASAEFMATPGLGKVKMEWNNNDLADGLGFNMYRMEHVNDTVLTKPVLINSTLITDTLYTDFAVTPNKKYYYYYKILRTNLSETDSSKVVSAIPFTASKGDANGDLNVNVLDITTIVAYLLNNKPQPFITEAADYNSDGNINVLDIVGVVNFVLNGGKKSAEIAMNQQIHLYLKNDTLFADAPVAIGGIQFDISGASSIDEIQKLKALDGFESGYSQQVNGLRLLYYSMSGKNIPAGNGIPLLKLKKGSGITEAIFADKSGTPISYDYLVSEIGKILLNPSHLVAELGQNFPNPFNRLTTIPIRIYEAIDEGIIRVFNVSGQELRVIRISNPIVGEHLLQWDSGTQKGLFVYLLEVRQGKKQIVCPARKMVVK